MADAIGEGFLEAVSRRTACVSQKQSKVACQGAAEASGGLATPFSKEEKEHLLSPSPQGAQLCLLLYVCPGSWCRAYPHASHSFQWASGLVTSVTQTHARVERSTNMPNLSQRTVFSWKTSPILNWFKLFWVPIKSFNFPLPSSGWRKYVVDV